MIVLSCGLDAICTVIFTYYLKDAEVAYSTSSLIVQVLGRLGTNGKYKYTKDGSLSRVSASGCAFVFGS